MKMICVLLSLCRGSVSVLRPVWGISHRTGPGSVSRADSGRHQRHLFALLQLLLPQRRPRVWGHAALQPGHRGHCGKRQPGGHLPLVTGTQQGHSACGKWGNKQGDIWAYRRYTGTQLKVHHKYFYISVLYQYHQYLVTTDVCCVWAKMITSNSMVYEHFP